MIVPQKFNITINNLFYLIETPNNLCEVVEYRQHHYVAIHVH